MASTTYPAETRDQVLQLLRDGEGVREAARRTGVTKSVVSRWAQAAGIVVAGADQTAAATEAVKLGWAKRKGELTDQAGDMAAVALERFQAETNARDAQAHATAFAILVDKAQLLSGGVTSRHEQMGLDRQRERVQAMKDEVAERRDAKAAKDGTTGG